MKDDERRFVAAAATGDSVPDMADVRAEYLRRKLTGEGLLDADGFLTRRGKHVASKMKGETGGLLQGQGRTGVDSQPGRADDRGDSREVSHRPGGPSDTAGNVVEDSWESPTDGDADDVPLREASE